MRLLIDAEMCGGVDLYERTIATHRFRPVTMSAQASGPIASREAIESVCRQPRIESIVSVHPVEAISGKARY